MKPTNLILKIYGEKVEGQWVLVCLDFSLASQADTLEEAKKNLEDQIKEYVFDALIGEDREHARELMFRRAPIKYYIKWWCGALKARIFGKGDNGQSSFCEPIPMAPA
ncbi:MAG: hypothetical protein H6R01_461 [Burkholderiaceae bacterium]|nr:hypothetical protein [Burkholderiaceae bacterium]